MRSIWSWSSLLLYIHSTLGIFWELQWMIQSSAAASCQETPGSVDPIICPRTDWNCWLSSGAYFTTWCANLCTLPESPLHHLWWHHCRNLTLIYATTPFWSLTYIQPFGSHTSPETVITSNQGIIQFSSMLKVISFVNYFPSLHPHIVAWISVVSSLSHGLHLHPKWAPNCS